MNKIPQYIGYNLDENVQKLCENEILSNNSENKNSLFNIDLLKENFKLTY